MEDMVAILSVLPVIANIKLDQGQGIAMILFTSSLNSTCLPITSVTTFVPSALVSTPMPPSDFAVVVSAAVVVAVVVAAVVAAAVVVAAVVACAVVVSLVPPAVLFGPSDLCRSSV